jgi:hypothetical protein
MQNKCMKGIHSTTHKRDEDVKAGGTDSAVLLGFISSSSGLILMCFLSDEQNVCVSDPQTSQMLADTKDMMITYQEIGKSTILTPTSVFYIVDSVLPRLLQSSQPDLNCKN